MLRSFVSNIPRVFCDGNNSDGDTTFNFVNVYLFSYTRMNT